MNLCIHLHVGHSSMDAQHQMLICYERLPYLVWVQWCWVEIWKAPASKHTTTMQIVACIENHMEVKQHCIHMKNMC
jgi:hypothetical protein